MKLLNIIKTYLYIFLFPFKVNIHKFPIQHQDAEKRVDPDDEQVCTLQELREKYAGVYAQDEIEEYWEAECAKTEVEEALQFYSPFSDIQNLSVYIQNIFCIQTSIVCIQTL